MYFFKVPTITAIIILGIHSVSSFDCSPPTGNVKCECTATSIECSGIQTNVSEIEDALNKADFSRMQTVVIKIDDLKFGPDFKFENTTIRNLTLGYGLQILPSNFFQGSSSLVSLHLGDNSIQDIDDQLFSSLSALEKLVLDGNLLHSLTTNMFMKLSNVRHLSIARNNLREIDTDIFKDLSALQTLTLNQNNFSSIGNLRMMSTSIVELNTNNCSITGSLEKDSLSGLPNLERLDLSHNELFEVKPHSLSALKNLEYLDLSYNSIQHLDNYAFFEMKNLVSLDLKHNRISVLKQTCFENLKKLVYLDLSSNSLTAVLCQYTTHFDSLEKMYLQNNRIKTFTQGAFFHSPFLQILNISGNNLECSCSLTDSALHLIENSTMKKEDLESISCIIPSNPPTLSSITDYKSSKCSTPLEQCKRPDDGIPDDYDYDDYSEPNTISIDNDTTIFPMTAESTTQKIASITDAIASLNITFESSTMTEPIIESTTLSTTKGILSETMSDITETAEPTTANILSTMDHSNISTSTASSVTTVPNTERTTQSTINTTATSAPSTGIVTTAAIVETVPNTKITTQSTENTSATSIQSTEHVATASVTESTTLSTTNNSLSETTTDIPVTTESTTGSILSVIDSSTLSSTSGSHVTTVLNTKSTTQTTENASVTSIPYTEPVTAESTSLLTTNVYDIKRTSNIPISDMSTTRSTFNPVLNMNTTVTGITPSSVTVGDSCSSLDLSVQDVPSESKFMVFNNFFYDSSTFCLKWTIVGDLQDVKRCAIRYTLNKGTVSKAIKCPLVSNEIKTWTYNEEIFKFCLDIYAPKKMNFCNLTLSGRTTMVTETMPFKSTEMPFKSTTILPPFSIIDINVYFNNSNLAFASWVVNAEVPLNLCNMTLTSYTATQSFDYVEGVFPCKSSSHRLRNVKETDIFKVCIESHHEKYGEFKKCERSVSPGVVSELEQEVKDPFNSALVPLICLLILLVIIVAIIIIKNTRKQESKRYNVRAEENKYGQRLKERPQSTTDQSTTDQSTRFSYLARENYDYA